MADQTNKPSGGSGTGVTDSIVQSLKSQITDSTQFLNFLQNAVWYGRTLGVPEQSIMDACHSGYQNNPSASGR